MTIVFEFGDEFWIEHIRLGGTGLPNGATRTDTTAVQLERAGRFVGASVYLTFITNNTNADALGAIQLREGSAGGVLNYGARIESVLFRFQKEAGAGDGSITFEALIFLKKAGS